MIKNLRTIREGEWARKTAESDRLDIALMKFVIFHTQLKTKPKFYSLIFHQ